jgi:Putative Ig domain/Trypsin-like peptidase domain
MFRRLAMTLGATVLGAALIGVPAPAAANATIQAASLNATISLSNCSASFVRFPSSLSTDRGLMLTNGHCYEGGFINAGVVLTNRASSRSGTLINGSGTSVGTVRADLVLYATMTGTDVTLYRLNQSFATITANTGVSPLTMSASHPVQGSSMFIASGFFKQIWNCTINSFVPTLREDQWTWKDSIKYDPNCDTIHGTSGSPIVDLNSNQQVGINNTGNDDGQSCTLNNPCEVDPDGTIHVFQGQSYGQQTYWFTTCLNASNGIDLTKAGCLLPGATAPGNTVTVTNPGSRSGVVGTATSLQIQATDSQAGQTLTYSATGLPAGLTINASTGLISGTPTTAGTYTVTVTARDTTNASGSATFTWTITNPGGGCSGQLLGNPGFESGTTPWTATSGVIGAFSGQTAHGGTRFAWLDGYGTTHTDTLSQSVTIPAGCHATLTYWLHIDSAETTTTTQFDKLTVTVGATTVQTFSNLNKATGYTQRTVNLDSFAGAGAIVLKFTGTEDSSLQTSFVIDDTAVTLS